ncbi:hypothetical protein [Ilyomonas limi]|nr:hypothetical protein [Ilyomonas limi]
MKKGIFFLLVLITILFAACAKTTYKGVEREVMIHHANNIFN